jgi:hypothetical protein
MTTPRTLAQAIPDRVRTAVYSILAAAIGLELVWDIIPDVAQGKVLSSLSVLGFGVAALNVSSS